MRMKQMQKARNVFAFMVPITVLAFLLAFATSLATPDNALFPIIATWFDYVSAL
jgi:hypothetical protein